MSGQTGSPHYKRALATFTATARQGVGRTQRILPTVHTQDSQDPSSIAFVDSSTTAESNEIDVPTIRSLTDQSANPSFFNAQPGPHLGRASTTVSAQA